MRTKQKARFNTGLVMPEQRFRQLTEKYFTEDPVQIQLYLIWQHVLLLVERTAPRTYHPHMAMYRTEFLIAQMEHNARQRKKKK